MSFADISALIVSQDQALIKRLERTLKAAGTPQVCSSESASGLFELAAANSVDLVIVDDRPPAIDGVKITREFRGAENSPDRKMRIFVLLDKRSIERTIATINAGPHEVMLKPFDRMKMLSRIHANVVDPREFVELNGYYGPSRDRSSVSDYRGPQEPMDSEPLFHA